MIRAFYILIISGLICRAQDLYGIGDNFSVYAVAPSNAVSMEWTVLVAQGAGGETVYVDDTSILVATPGGYSSSGSDAARLGEEFDFSASGNRESIITETFTTEQAPEPRVAALSVAAFTLFVYLTTGKRGKHVKK